MAAPPAALAVVGPRFCAPHTLPLTLVKYNSSCTVDDAGGATVLRMERVPFFSFPRYYVLRDAAGVPVLSLKPKVFRGDSHDACDLLFTATASSFGRWPFRGLDVFLAGNTRRGATPDFRSKGDFHRSGYFYLGNSDRMIASVNRMKSSGRFVFGVTVFPHADYAFIVALVLISHDVSTNIEREEERRRQQEKR